MSFNAMFNNDNDCSVNQFNPLNNVLKNYDQDKSIHKDKLYSHPSTSAFPMKSRLNLNNNDQFIANFNQQQNHNLGSTGPFGLEAMRSEVNRISSPNLSSTWTNEYKSKPLNYPSQQREQDLMEHSFNNSFRSINSNSWNEEFIQQQHQSSVSPIPNQQRQMYASPRSNYMFGNSPQFSPSPSMSTSNQMNTINHEAENAKWDQQFERLSEQIEQNQKEKGKKVIDKVEADHQSKQEVDNDKDIEQQFKQALRDEGLDIEKHHDYLAEFENVWNTMKEDNNATADSGYYNKNLADWEKQFADEMNAARESIDNDIYANVNENKEVIEEYKFENENQYLEAEDPFSLGQRLLREGGPLSEPALAFEAAAQQNSHNSKAWLWLGYTHAMDEKEEAAIRALERCLIEDGNEIEAMIPLAISYTNEGNDNAATLTLERWITRKYPETLTPDSGTSTNSTWPWATHQRVIDAFLHIARSQSSSADKLDADVQVGLGVLSYATSNYDQAKDCFASALSLRPNDWLLWNRLGATLANGGKPEEAIDAYTRALDLRPTFTRAIHNLGVSCLNIGCYKEAVEHILSAISLQQSSTKPEVIASVNESQSLWQTLRRALFAMERHDLASIAVPGTSIDKFKNQGFEI